MSSDINGNDKQSKFNIGLAIAILSLTAMLFVAFTMDAYTTTWWNNWENVQADSMYKFLFSSLSVSWFVFFAVLVLVSIADITLIILHLIDYSKGNAYKTVKPYFSKQVFLTGAIAVAVLFLATQIDALVFYNTPYINDYAARDKIVSIKTMPGFYLSAFTIIALSITKIVFACFIKNKKV